MEISFPEEQSSKVMIDHVEYEVDTIATVTGLEKTRATLVLCTMSQPHQSPDVGIPNKRRKIFGNLYEIFRGIHRQGIKSVVVIAICAAAVCLMASYMGNRKSHEMQFEKLSEVYQITGQVQNAMGNYSQGLVIDSKLVGAVESSPYVGMVKEQIELIGVTSGDSLQVVGTNLLDKSQVATDHPVWKDGKNASVLQTDEAVCVVSSNRMERMGWKMGDTISLQIQYYDLPYWCGEEVVQRKQCSISGRVSFICVEKSRDSKQL